MTQQMEQESKESKNKKEDKGIENPDCPCTYPCVRHGKCTECQAYHRADGSRTQCGK